ncbi:MAG: acyl carrier protein [Clostridiales bacterium]|nr:acyl carrier protein [Clostridiales bacterium]
MKDKVIEIIRKACALDETVSESSELQMLSLDSLSFVSAIVDLETEFGICFDVDELTVFSWTTVGDVIKAVEERINA